MNNTKGYIDEIKSKIAALSDSETKEKALRLTSGAKCIGVSVPKIKQLVKEYKIELSKIDFELICEIADKLFEDEYREEILFAVFVIAQQKKNLLKIEWNRIDFWLNHIDNWETCDQLSSNIVTTIIVKNPDLLAKLCRLTKSENKWKRRFAAATVANINHGGRAYPKETFLISRELLEDGESVVTKAVGWAIREISKKCPNESFDFLQDNIEIIPLRLLKESSELLPEKEKRKIIETKMLASDT